MGTTLNFDHSVALQIPKDAGAAPHAEVHGIAEYDAQAAVARRLYHRLPEAGPYGLTMPAE